MDAFAEFEGQVEEALTHLYDPAYHPPESLCLRLGFRDTQSLDLIREILVQAIQELEPATEIPTTARVRRIYELLDLRYIQDKTQKEGALRLGITVRHLRREQQLAIHLLAERLWEVYRAQAETAEQHQASLSRYPPLQETETTTHQSTVQDESNWREQVRHEIHVLQANSPGILANVQQTLAAVIELADALASGVAIVQADRPVAPDLWVAIHPSVLREVLIAAVDKLVPLLQPSGHIQFSTLTAPDSVRIVLTRYPAVLPHVPDIHFVDEISDIYGGNLEIRQQQNLVEFCLTLPLVKPVAVLVVDDNDDLVHFYRRFVEETRYVIHHVAHGEHLWEKIKSVPPDVIVLDVMLPDVDGWDLLRQLRKHPQTKAVPIIVCSVIRREELAKTLGATFYLSKPVHRNDFLRSLEVATHSTTPRQQEFRDP